MKFDAKDNLCLYEPGAGCSGVHKCVVKYGSDEIVYFDSGYNLMTSSSSGSEFGHDVPKKEVSKLQVSMINPVKPKIGKSVIKCDGSFQR